MIPGLWWSTIYINGADSSDKKKITKRVRGKEENKIEGGKGGKEGGNGDWQYRYYCSVRIYVNKKYIKERGK